MANLIIAGNVKIEVDDCIFEDMQNILVIQCDSPDELRAAIANRKMIDFTLFDAPHDEAKDNNREHTDHVELLGLLKKTIEIGEQQASEWDRFWEAMGVKSEDITVDQAIEKYKMLESSLSEYTESYRRIMLEQCAPDEQHCTCVPSLRLRIRNLEGYLVKAKSLLEDAKERVQFSAECAEEEIAKEDYKVLDAIAGFFKEISLEE